MAALSFIITKHFISIIFMLVSIATSTSLEFFHFTNLISLLIKCNKIRNNWAISVYFSIEVSGYIYKLQDLVKATPNNPLSIN